MMKFTAFRVFILGLCLLLAYKLIIGLYTEHTKQQIDHALDDYRNDKKPTTVVDNNKRSEHTIDHGIAVKEKAEARAPLVTSQGVAGWWELLDGRLLHVEQRGNIIAVTVVYNPGTEEQYSLTGLKGIIAEDLVTIEGDVYTEWQSLDFNVDNGATGPLLRSVFELKVQGGVLKGEQVSYLNAVAKGTGKTPLPSRRSIIAARLTEAPKLGKHDFGLNYYRENHGGCLNLAGVQLIFGRSKDLSGTMIVCSKYEDGNGDGKTDVDSPEDVGRKGVRFRGKEPFVIIGGFAQCPETSERHITIIGPAGRELQIFQGHGTGRFVMGYELTREMWNYPGTYEFEYVVNDRAIGSGTVDLVP